MAVAEHHKQSSNGVKLPVVDHSTAKRCILVFLLVYDATLAVLLNFMPQDDQVLDYVVGLPILIPVLIWCHLDAKERDHKISIAMKLSLVFLFVLAYPLYTFQTQGKRGWATFTFLTFYISGFIVLLLVRFF